MNDARLLIVGGENGISRAWIDPLREAGANIAVVADGAGALRHLDLLEPEIIIIDLQLSGALDGFDTCRSIRARSSALVVMASSTDGPYDEVVALAVGADHFVPGATPPEVLIARLRSLIRRARGALVVGSVGAADGSPGPDHATSTNSHGSAHERQRPVAAVSPGRAAPRTRTDRTAAQARLPIAGGAGVAGPDGPTERIVDGELEIDLAAREVKVDGHRVALTRIEFDLLATLARYPRRVFSRDQLMASAWEFPVDGSHVLDAYLSRMRGKITAAGGDRVGHAVRGVGYRLRS